MSIRTRPINSHSDIGAQRQAVFDCRDYGALGDGATDDTTAIQAAIDAAEAVRGIVELPAGEYVISGALVINSQGTVLRGSSTQGTIASAATGSVIRTTATTGDALTIAADAVTVEGIQLNGPASGSGRGLVIDDGAGAPPTQSRVVVRRVWVREFGGDGIAIVKNEACLLDTVWSTSNGGDGCDFSTVGGSRCTNPTLINCRFASNTGTHQLHITDTIGPVVINCQCLTGSASNANCRLQSIFSAVVIGGDFEGGGASGIQISGTGGSIIGAHCISVTTGINVTSWTDGVIEACRFTSSLTNSIATDSGTRIRIGFNVDSATSGMNLHASSEIAQVPKRQSVAYAASVTPNPTLGEYVEVAALTGAIAIAATTKHAKGMRLTFRFLQDGTGGRAVTWNAQYKHAWSDTGNTANKQSTITFAFDGTNWVPQGAQSPYV